MKKLIEQIFGKNTLHEIRGKYLLVSSKTHPNDKECFAIFDKNDKAVMVNSKPLIMYRSECHSSLNPTDFYHRGANVFVRNNDKLYVPVRSNTKDLYPGCLDLSSGEHVKIGESYKRAAIRGLMEELGIDADADRLKHLFKMKIDSPKNHEWVRYYEYEHKGKIILSEETASGSWIEISELKKNFSKYNFRKDQLHCVKEYLFSR